LLHAIPESESPAVTKSTLVALLIGLNLLGTTVMASEELLFNIKFAEGTIEVRDYPTPVAAEVSVCGTEPKHDPAILWPNPMTSSRNS